MVLLRSLALYLVLGLRSSRYLLILLCVCTGAGRISRRELDLPLFPMGKHPVTGKKMWGVRYNITILVISTGSIDGSVDPHDPAIIKINNVVAREMNGHVDSTSTKGLAAVATIEKAWLDRKAARGEPRNTVTHTVVVEELKDVTEKVEDESERKEEEGKAGGKKQKEGGGGKGKGEKLERKMELEEEKPRESLLRKKSWVKKEELGEEKLEEGEKLEGRGKLEGREKLEEEEEARPGGDDTVVKVKCITQSKTATLTPLEVEDAKEE